MNLVHRRFCRSDKWRAMVKKSVLPWALADVDIGRNVLEVGSGPGIITDLLRPRVEHLTCIEIDSKMARALADRTANQNVTVLHEDATAMSLGDAIFDGAVCFTMLHHVASPALQDRLLSEVARVLRAGGVFAGFDSVYSRSLRLFHLFDTMVLVDPATFPKRLAAAGFTDISVDANPRAFRFHARKPL